MSDAARDPSGEPVKQAWSEVAEGFQALGRMMRDQYRASGAEGASPQSGTASGPDAEEQATSGALRDALERFLAAGRDLGDRASDVARDAEVKAQARRAATSLNDALSATVDMIGEQVGGLVRRSKGAEPGTDDPRWEPPAPGDRR
jgi:hypothetical protein